GRAAEVDRCVERPGALVGVLGPVAVVPRVDVRIGERLGKLVAGHIGERGEALAVRRPGVLWVAARVAVEVEEEGELNHDTLDRAVAVPGAVPGRAAPRVDVQRA